MGTLSLLSSVRKELYGTSSDILWFLNEHWNNPMGLIFATQQLLGESGIPHPFSPSQGIGLVLLQATKIPPPTKPIRQWSQ